MCRKDLFEQKGLKMLNQVPYTGKTFVGIPEFQSLGTIVGQNVAGLVAGKSSLEQL